MLKSKAFITFLGIGAASLALALGADAVATQGGCPWCVTPSNCDDIDEPTDIDGCYNTQETGCQEIIGDGECEPIETLLASTAGRDYVLSRGIELRDVRVIQTGALGERTAGVLADGTLAVWNCQGRLQALFGQDSDGRSIVYDHAKHAERLISAASVRPFNRSTPKIHLT